MTRPELPQALTLLVDRLLEKNVDLRPPDAATVRAELEALARTSWVPTSRASAIPSALGTDEQRLVCLIVAAGPKTTVDVSADTLLSVDDGERRRAVHDVALRFGAHLEWLADGGFILVLRHALGTATDLVAHAARCAIALRAVLPDVPLALATGRAQLRGPLPVGPTVERAVERLRAAHAIAGRHAGVTVLDDTTERLLDPSFEARDGRLIGTRAVAAHEMRTLLGKKSLFVGREEESARLRAALDACVREARARAVLVLGVAGLGKTRLVTELVASLDPGAVERWHVRADPVRGGSPLALVESILRSAVSLGDDAPLADVRAAIDRRWGGSHAEIAPLLDELFGSSAPSAAPTVRGTTGRVDPSMAEVLRRGFVALLDAVVARTPLIVVLEDLHWCDSTSLRFFDAALDEVQGPLLVVGVARPELRERNPSLWTRRRLDELRLGALSPRASRALVRHALGDDERAAAIEALLVERADGNPFFLEELVRATAEGRSTSLPDTVLAMSVARLQALSADERRVLRAASIFGESFRSAEALALLPREEVTAPALAALLTELNEDEVLVRERSDRSRFRFRHAYLRDAAYSMLTDDDRVLGHRLAGEHLAALEESEPAVVAEHFEIAKDPRAGEHYLKAARRALRRSAPEVAIELADRGLAAAPSGRVRTDLLRLQSGTHSWRGDFHGMRRISEQLLAAAPPGSKVWWDGAIGAVHSSVFLGAPGRARRAACAFLEVEPTPDAIVSYGRAIAASVPVYYYTGDGPCRAMHARFRMGASMFADADPMVRAMLLWLDSYERYFVDDDTWSAIATARRAQAAFEALGDTQRAIHVEGEIATYIGDLGDIDEHDRYNRDVWSRTSHMALGPTLGLGFLAFNLVQAGRAEPAPEILGFVEPRAIERDYVGGLASIASARAALSLDAGDFRAAERWGLRAAKLGVTTIRFGGLGYPMVVRARLGLGDRAGALRAGRAALVLSKRLDAIGPTRSWLRLAHCEALAAAGDRVALRGALDDAIAILRARAEKIEDETFRRRYLEETPVSRATFALRASV